MREFSFEILEYLAGTTAIAAWLEIMSDLEIDSSNMHKSIEWLLDNRLIEKRGNHWYAITEFGLTRYNEYKPHYVKPLPQIVDLI